MGLVSGPSESGRIPHENPPCEQIGVDEYMGSAVRPRFYSPTAESHRVFAQIGSRKGLEQGDSSFGAPERISLPKAFRKWTGVLWRDTPLKGFSRFGVENRGQRGFRFVVSKMGRAQSHPEES